jgi:apolipoprotein D and lipocalin family protein
VTVLGLSALLSGCATIPEGAKAVDNFDKDRYLGKWYEIARLDFAFEKNLNNTTAQYSIGKNGMIDVLNAGYNYKANRRAEAKGKARFRGADTAGELEVSFFGPFFAAYNVIALDPDYRYAMIAGSDLNYLWILSRTATIPDDVREKYVTLAKSLGYDTGDLIWVEHAK